MKIIELFGVRPAKGDVGIEIECEGKGLVPLDTDVWQSVDDGSLRGVYPHTKAEYIFARPIERKFVRTALETLAETLKNSKLDFNYRTSVHVHINVQNLELEQALAMMYLYYLCEPALINFSGKERAGNNFCLRLRDAEGVVGPVSSFFRDMQNVFGYLGGDHIRYAAMNLEALRKYGSIEFRSMEGNMDVERISAWADMLLSLRDKAIQLGNPLAVRDMYVELGPEKFLVEVFGLLAEKLKREGLEGDMNESFSLSYDLPAAYQEGLLRQKKPHRYALGSILNLDGANLVVKAGGRVVPMDGLKAGQFKVIKVPHLFPKFEEEEELEFDKDIEVVW